MLKRVMIAAAVLACSTAISDAETLFQGTLRFTAVNAACANVASAGNQDNALFHPASVPGNDNFTALNAIYDFGARSWKLLAAGSFTSSYQQVSNVGIGWSDYTPSKPTFILVSKQQPATLLSTTPNVTLFGKIKNPNGNIGEETCVATFIFVGVNSQE
jgi:uncharacterized membrane protein